MKTNIEGFALIKAAEGCRLKAYPDPGTGAEPFTIGYGHTRNVNPGDTITKEQADFMLAIDLQKFEDHVSELVKVPINENQFAALVSLCYNIGAEALAGSTLLRLLNSGAYDNAAAQFLTWNHAGGKVMAGLTRRREAEKALFETPIEVTT